jgi:hypothetical protein
MKRIALLITIIFALTAVNNGNIIVQNDKPFAKIQFDTTVHDYGKIKKGSNGDCVFKYKNVGNDVLFITRVAKSCGCTTPEYSREPLMPGQTAEIKVGYDTNILGKFNKKITVFSNAVNNSVILTIKGEVVE